MRLERACTRTRKARKDAVDGISYQAKIYGKKLKYTVLLFPVINCDIES